MGEYYTALVCGEYVESGKDLGKLVRLCREEIMPGSVGEDVVIYHGKRVAAVLRGDGLDVLLETIPRRSCEFCPAEGGGCSVCA